MSQLVKTKRQANFKDFKRFGAFKGLVEAKNLVFNSFLCKLGLFWQSWAFKTRVKRAHTCQKRPNLHTNSSNKLLCRYYMIVYMYAFKLLFQKILFQKKNSDDSCCSVSCLDDSAIFPFFFSSSRAT
jgi:hypothetical protein